MLEKNIKLLEEELARGGYTKEEVARLYHEENYSKNQIVTKINEDLNKNLLHKAKFKTLFDYWGIPQKSIAEVNKNRMERVNKSLKRSNKDRYEEAIELYKSGLSLNEIYKTQGVSISILSRELQRAGIPLRKQIEFKDVIVALAKEGLGEKDIEEFYKTHSQQELIEYVNEKTSLTVGRKVIASLLAHWKLEKTESETRSIQGRRSREAARTSLTMLSQAGFATIEELATFYEENPSLTFESLAEKMNTKVGETFFTPRWLTRNITPLLSEDSLGGTSRQEKSFGEWLQENTNQEIRTSVRTLIAPYEVDFYLPNLNLAFEFNGTYWHSDEFLKTNHGMPAHAYHTMKVDEAAKHDVQLLFIWEDDWTQRRSECEAAVLRYLQKGLISPMLLRIK